MYFFGYSGRESETTAAPLTGRDIALMRSTVQPYIEPLKEPTTRLYLQLHNPDLKLSIDIPLSGTLLTLKEAIASITGIAPLHQHLSFKGIPLPSTEIKIKDWDRDQHIYTCPWEPIILILKDHEIKDRVIVPGKDWRKLSPVSRPGFDMTKRSDHPDNQLGKIAHTVKPAPRRPPEEITADPILSAYYEAMPKLEERIKEYNTAREVKLAQKDDPASQPLPPLETDEDGNEVQPLNDLYDLIQGPVQPGKLYRLHARLNHLEADRYLLRDTRGYALVHHVPPTLTLTPGIWYTLTGTLLPPLSHPVGILSFLSAHPATLPPYITPKQNWTEKITYPPRQCYNCGADSDDHDEDCWVLDDTCPFPVEPRTLQCWDCREVGHRWWECRFMVPPGGYAEGRVRRPCPDMGRVEWEGYWEFGGAGDGEVRERVGRIGDGV
ncbi:hypothetical protein BJ508DRAFT_335669 [Ascobolus immersus RN42]|uniref:Ubiquitin-like domain-containing protein n=1 Tax=Ascobolus immersus RN42 TaxID=1160509 RepID=A0A3N4HG47_ASCIM|nr:hypothetical protein BJ508DRAFT_316010 [Ascobolus immersus RN42]RPA71828.1 hypothetical protein BJ508DRAFT_335669 [Ascobolus immersus RN42]